MDTQSHRQTDRHADSSITNKKKKSFAGVKQEHGMWVSILGCRYLIFKRHSKSKERQNFGKKYFDVYLPFLCKFPCPSLK